MATTAPKPETKPTGKTLRCRLGFHRWRRSVNEGMAFKRCVRCGKEREIPAVVQYPGG